MRETLRFAIPADRKGGKGRRLRCAGELHDERAVVPMLQRRGIFRGTTFDLERLPIEQYFAASVILIFVHADERLECAEECSRIGRRGRRRHEFCDVCIARQDFLLVDGGVKAQSLIHIVRAHRLGERREVKIRRDKDARVFIWHERHHGSHARERTPFFDDLMPRVIVTTHSQSIVKTGCHADRR